MQQLVVAMNYTHTKEVKMASRLLYSVDEIVENMKDRMELPSPVDDIDDCSSNEFDGCMNSEDEASDHREDGDRSEVQSLEEVGEGGKGVYAGFGACVYIFDTFEISKPSANFLGDICTAICVHEILVCYGSLKLFSLISFVIIKAHV